MSMINTILSKTHNAKSNDKFKVLEGLIKKHYSLITNPNKLANGNYPFQAVLRDLTSAYNINRVGRFDRVALPDEYVPYAEWIIKNIHKLDDKTGVFFVVREDIPPVQRLVQVAHCASVLGQKVSVAKQDMMETNFIVLGGPKSEKELVALSRQLSNKNFGACFVEPDNNMGMSAFCTKPMRYSRARRLKALKGLELLNL